MSYGYATVRKVWNRWDETDDVEVLKVRLFKTESERNNGINLEWKKIWNDRNFMNRPSDVVKFETKNEYIQPKKIEYSDVVKIQELSHLFVELMSWGIIQINPEEDVQTQMTTWVHEHFYQDRMVLKYKNLVEQEKQKHSKK